MLWIFILLNYVTGYTLSQDTLCTKILSVDCTIHYIPSQDEFVCASNGVTYKNCCHFAQAKCKDDQITIKHGGKCNSTMTTPNTTTSTCSTMVTTTMTTTTGDVFTNLFCSGVAAGSVKCTDELDPYCGTDGIFYLNNCYFEEARCKNNNLSKQPIDICKGLTTKGIT